MGPDSVSKQVQQTNSHPKDKLLVSRREAAWRLSISLRAVDYLIAGGFIQSKRIASRVLIPVQALVRFASSNHPGPLAK